MSVGGDCFLWRLRSCFFCGWMRRRFFSSKRMMKIWRTWKILILRSSASSLRRRIWRGGGGRFPGGVIARGGDRRGGLLRSLGGRLRGRGDSCYWGSWIDCMILRCNHGCRSSLRDILGRFGSSRGGFRILDCSLRLRNSRRCRCRRRGGLRQQ